MLRVEHGSEYGARLITTEPIGAGQLIAHLPACEEIEAPTYLSIQVGPGRHIEDLGVFANLNHSCRPSVVVDTDARAVRAARDLGAGDELTFFYPSTEWDMSRPFACLCGAPDCLGTIAGARYLPAETLSRYSVNRHIRELAAIE